MAFHDRSELCISIHATREGGDAKKLLNAVARGSFQSTPPVRAATTARQMAEGRPHISIHATREGGDRFRERSFSAIKISIHATREGGDFT